MPTVDSENSDQAKNGWFTPLVVFAALVLSGAVYFSMLYLDAVNGWRPVLTFWVQIVVLFAIYLGTFLFLRSKQKIHKSAIWLVIAGAVLFRLTLLPAGLPFDLTFSEKLEGVKADVTGVEVAYEEYQLFDNDIWRYIWDGHVYANGINPYLYAPDDERLDTIAGDDSESVATESFLVFSGSNDLEIWSEIRDNVNYAEVPTIYPPVSQFVFLISHTIAPGSVFMMKTTIVVFDLLALLFIGLTLRHFKLPMSYLILYAWNPLVLKVFAGSGHADSILVAFLCASIYFLVSKKRVIAAVMFALAISSKFTPIILFPLIAKRLGFKRSLLVPLVLVSTYLPFVGAGWGLFAGLSTFASEWQFNSGFVALLNYMLGILFSDPTSTVRAISGLTILAVVGYLFFKDDGTDQHLVGAIAATLGVMIVLSPTVMPWYLTWVIPFSIISRQYIWLWFSFLVFTAFHIMIYQIEYGLALWIEYGAFVVIAITGYLIRHYRSDESGSLAFQGSLVPMSFLSKNYVK